MSKVIYFDTHRELREVFDTLALALEGVDGVVFRRRAHGVESITFPNGTLVGFQVRVLEVPDPSVLERYERGEL